MARIGWHLGREYPEHSLCTWRPGVRYAPSWDGGPVISAIEQIAESHGLVDERGRVIGGVVTIWPETEQQYRYTIEPEQGRKSCSSFGSISTGRFLVTIRATRDRKPFGSSHYGTAADTLEQARKLARRKLNAQRRRYAKRYQPGQHISKLWTKPAPEPDTAPDAECSDCGARYWSGEGHPDRAVCASCCALAAMPGGSK